MIDRRLQDSALLVGETQKAGREAPATQGNTGVRAGSSHLHSSFSWGGFQVSLRLCAGAFPVLSSSSPAESVGSRSGRLCWYIDRLTKRGVLVHLHNWRGKLRHSVLPVLALGHGYIVNSGLVCLLTGLA